MERIYLDNNATTALDPSVIQVMSELMNTCYGNPSSVHFEGQEAHQVLSKSRRQVACHLGVRPQEIIFTSGATEGLNLVLRGIIGWEMRGHVITSDLEHSAVYGTCKEFQARGVDVTFLSPGMWGAVKAEDLQQAIRPDTRLIALMGANNETGVKVDLAALAAVAESAGVPLLIDGVVLLGKERFQVPSGISAMSFSAHKLHGPKGVGCVFVRRGQSLVSLMTGGSHEQQRRPGTQNVLGIAGFAAALEAAEKALPQSTERMLSLRNRLEDGLAAEFPIVINGEGPRICNTANIAFPGISAESLLMNLDLEGVSVSHGSACISGGLEPSRTLLNMGIDRSVAASSLRFSLCKNTTVDEINRAVAIILKLIRRIG